MKRTVAFLLVSMLCLCAPALAAAASAPSIEYGTSEARNHEATLHFAIDPEGLETSYEVMYGEVGEGYRPFHEPLDGVLPAGDEPVALEKQLPVFFEGALATGTEYHYRVVAKNAEGETLGGDQTFTSTDGPKPVFVSVAGIQTGPSSVTFTGTVDPEGAPLTGCRFRWVDAETFHQAGFEKSEGEGIARFGRTVPCHESFGEIGSGTEPVSVHAEGTAIKPGDYFFRLEGENAYEDATAFAGPLFTVSADFEPPGPPTEPPYSPHGDPGPPFEPPGPPAEVPPVHNKPCPQVHRGKARNAKTHGHKHRLGKHHTAKQNRGKACGRR